MEELTSSLIKLCTVGRPAQISSLRIEQEIYNHLCIRFPLYTQYYITGSLHEGMPGQVCSDHDFMMNKPNFPIVLFDSEVSTYQHSWGYVKAEHNPDEPAFLRLKADEKECLHSEVRSIIDEDGYLKTNTFIEFNKKENEWDTVNCDVERHGPSLAVNRDLIIDTTVMTDNVFCLKSQTWPSVTTSFFTRQRPSNWPSKEILNRVSSLECLVIPVGHPDNPEINTEWRMSFSLAEKELIQNMCGTYISCMCAMKALKNRYIVYTESDRPTPFCSYFIKTACLWMCETRKENNVMDLIRKVIHWLISCYERHHLPHYFVPQQNLIGHLSVERCDRVVAALTGINSSLWSMAMSSIPISPYVRDNVINEMCDELQIARVNEADDYTHLETNLLMHTRAKQILELSIEKLFMYTLMYQSFLYSTWVSRYYGNLLSEFEQLIRTQKCSEILKLPEDIIMPIVSNIKNVVSKGHEELFKPSLYRFLGDVYTYFLIYFRRAGTAVPSHYLSKPLHYYELGKEMLMIPDNWCDVVGGNARIVIHHYLMDNYKELKEELAVLIPAILDDMNEDLSSINQQVNIEVPTDFTLVRDAWGIDEILQNIFLHNQLELLLHPIALVFYINARVSLKEGDTEGAHFMAKKMDELVKISVSQRVIRTTGLLMQIIQGLLGLSEATVSCLIQDTSSGRLMVWQQNVSRFSTSCDDDTKQSPVNDVLLPDHQDKTRYCCLHKINSNNCQEITPPNNSESDYTEEPVTEYSQEEDQEESSEDDTTESIPEYIDASTEPPTKRLTEMLTEKLTTEVPKISENNATEDQTEVVPSKPLGPYQFQVLNDTSAKVCIKAHLEAELIVHYISSKKTSLQQATIPVDNKATVGGTCTAELSRLTLDWSSKTGCKYRLQTTFNMINDSVKCMNSKNGRCWMLTSIQFTYDSSDSTYFYHAKDGRIKTVQSSLNKEFFKTPDTMSQSCEREVLLKLPAASDDRNKDEVDIKFIKLHIQPFSLVNNTFGPRKQCEEGNGGSQSVVSVAVGATLGVVILIVIIIYAVGRRIGAINDRTGYKSVD